MSASLLSVVVPVYNEARTIRNIIARIRSAPLGLPREIIVVDDASGDGTADILRGLSAEGDGDLRVLRHPVNRTGSSTSGTTWATRP